METPFLGLVGVGNWGENLAMDFDRVLRAVCDLDKEQLEYYSDIEHIKYTTTVFEDLLEDPEITAIAIATPAHTHFDLAKRVLLSGRDCYVEKPMTVSSKDAAVLVRIAKMMGRVLMVGHIIHYTPALQSLDFDELVETVQNCTDIVAYRYTKSKQSNINVIWNLGPHDISFIVRLLGPPHVVVAHLHQEECIIKLQYPEKEVKVFLNQGTANKKQEIVATGPNGELFTLCNNTIFLNNYFYSSKENTPLEVECETFINCCKKRQFPYTDGCEGLVVTRVLEMAEKSAAKAGKPVKSFFCHESSYIDPGAQVGFDTKIWHFCHLMPTARVGNNCTIGQNCFIAGTIGHGCKVQNNVSIYEGVVAGDNVFFGPSCVLTNDKTPRAAHSKNGNYTTTTIEDGVTIGANATIMCGVTLGEGCMIGAGSVVTKDIPPGVTVIGNPAHVL